jgi:hypothetical protein
LLIENKANGMVVETTNKDGSGELALAQKVGKKEQCWLIEREEKGFVIRNVASGYSFNVPHGHRHAGVTMISYPFDRTKEATPNTRFQLTEFRREVVFSPTCSGLILTANETKIKGVTTYSITQEKKEEPPPDKQRWVLTEAR